MKTRIFFVTTVFPILMFSSCKKDGSPLEQSSINLADDDAVSEAVFEDIFSSVDNATITLDNAMKNGDTKSEFLSGDSCPAITVIHPSTGIWPKTVTIDYGTGCIGFFDNTRSGKIIIEVTGPAEPLGRKELSHSITIILTELKSREPKFWKMSDRMKIRTLLFQ